VELSILIAANGGIERTMRCLESLAGTVPDGVDCEVVFVDNGSRDGTFDALRRVEGDLVLLRNEHERDYAAACGQAAQAARGKFLIVVPQNVVAEPGWVEPLLAALQSEPAPDAVRPNLIPADEASAAPCVALDRDRIAEVLSGEPGGVSEPDHERIGNAILGAEARARLEPESILKRELPSAETPVPTFPPLDDLARFEAFLVSLAGAYGPSGRTSPPVESSALTAVLVDGTRPTLERAIAGAIISASTPTEAIAATARRLVQNIDPGQRRLIGSLLEPHGWGEAWQRLATSEVTPTESLFSWGFNNDSPEYSQVVADLQFLNDVLATSALAGRYWIVCGMLLGWARGGDLIRGDLDDFDLAFSADDSDRFRSAMVDLVKAGFLPRYRYPGVGEPATALTLVRHGAKFEFYRMDPDGPDHYRHHSFGHLDGVAVQNVHRSLRQELVPIQFLDRLWMKSQDHELELTHEYGDWRTPDPAWDYMQAHSITGRVPWDRSRYDLLGLAVV
jgi:Glycosyl transferase family 2